MQQLHHGWLIILFLWKGAIIKPVLKEQKVLKRLFAKDMQPIMFSPIHNSTTNTRDPTWTMSLQAASMQKTNMFGLWIFHSNPKSRQ